MVSVGTDELIALMCPLLPRHAGVLARVANSSAPDMQAAEAEAILQTLLKFSIRSLVGEVILNKLFQHARWLLGCMSVLPSALEPFNYVILPALAVCPMLLEVTSCVTTEIVFGIGVCMWVAACII